MNLLKKRWLKIIAGLVIFIAVYGVAGHWLLPLWLKSFVPRQIQQATGRAASIGQIAINPFALTVRVDGLTVFGPDGHTPAARIGELYADLSLSSLIHRALVIDEIRIQHPQLAFARLTPERFSYSDIVDRLRNAPKSSGTSQPIHFAFYNIQLTDGQVDFDDHVSGRQHHIEQLQFSLPFISDLAHKVQIFVQPRLSARINGSPVEIKGRSQPFAADHATHLDLDFDAFDIPTYLGLVPIKLDYVPTAGRLDSRLSVSFRQPANAPPQVTLQGTLNISGLEIRQRTSGAIIGAGKLNVDLRRSDLLKMQWDIAEAGIDHLKVNLQRHDKPALAVDSIALQDATYVGAAEKLQAKSLTISAPMLALQRDRNGRIDLLSALIPPADHGVVHKSTVAQPAAKPTPPLTARLDKFSIADGHVLFDDDSTAKPVHIDLQALKFSAESVTTEAGVRIPWNLSAALGKGTLALKGGVAADPLKLDVDADISGVDLSPLQGYFSSKLNVDIRRMNLGTQGHLDLEQAQKGAWNAHYAGTLDVTHLAVRDKLTGQPFLNWKSLSIARLDVQYPARGAPFQLLLGKIALSDFYARVIVNANARLNLQDVVASNDAGGAAVPVSVTAPTPADASPPAVAKSVPAPTPQAGPSPRIRLGPVTLTQGRVSYTDNYIKPNYSAHLTDLAGSIGRIASDQPAPAAVELNGQLDGDGTLALKGAVNPLAKPLYLDLKADARDIELTRLTPYAAKYAGYDIDKGKLTVNVSYHIENQQLQAQNHVYLDQLTFGKRVDSPEATKLPVLLAVALLKDRNGVIDVNLPVSGSLSDPQFSIGGVILRVLGNLLAKAVTSPFALLGSAFGGGEELSYVEFAPGSAQLSAADSDKLDKLVKALKDRPALKLDISGRADPAVDIDGLKHEALMQRVRREKIRSLGDDKSSDADHITVGADEYPKYLKKAYDREKFPKPRNFIGLAKDLPQAEMEKLMLANIPVDENSLHDLAMQRASVVRSYLTGTGKIDGARLFLAAPHLNAEGIHDPGKTSRVDFQLK
ncbi:MAG TPA: DUF748 domain-containing protein [Stenotrophobium sp.]|nr:DUF748 domain-containing protein [Stenotrophobium sp.]